MCGICGWFDGGSSPLLDISSLEKMAATMVHRGPDASGTFLHERVGLAHRRLKIVDLEGGGQPMSLPNGLTTVFNGEIYNYIELKGELEAKGHIFRTKSDTEVLLAAYETWGEGCLEKFNGMFAFVVYDNKRGELFFARDRMGKKPFYYHHSGGVFAFASEIKSLLTLPPVRKSLEMDPRSISDFLSLGYILAPKTIYANIKKLPAAHYGVLDIKSGRLDLREYWKLASFYSPDAKRTVDHQSRNAFISLFEDACRIRLRADVPVGVFLSGGVDSSAVAAFAGRLTNGTVRTFCVAFGDQSYDESAYANLAARHCGLQNETIRYEGGSNTPQDALIRFFDEPFGDTSSMPTYMVACATSRHVKVALSGDGADEIFGGYPTYMADRYYRYYRHIPDFIKDTATDISRYLLKPSYRKLSFDYKFRKFLSARGTLEYAHYHWRTIFSGEEKRRLMAAELSLQCGDYDPFSTFETFYSHVPNAGFLDRSLYVDQKTWLQDDILVKVDRMSMANGLEVRSPFLDHRIVEFAATLPENAKIIGREQKAFLKDCMRDILPPEIINRPKAGFGAPLTPQARHAPAPVIDGVLNNGFRLHPDGEDVTYKAFCLSVLGNWYKMCCKEPE